MYFILVGIVFSFPEIFCLSKFCEENGKTYQFEGVKKYSWTKAAEHCKESGGTLAYVRSFFLEPCISNTLGEIGRGSYSIGGKKHPSRNWTWMDDTPITQPSYWARGEPNNVGGNENCLQFKFYGANFHWNDVSCDEMAGFICQFNFLISESTLPELPEQTTLYEESFVNFHDDQSTKSKTGQQATISTTDDQSVTSKTSGQSTTSTTSSQSKTFTQETSVNATPFFVDKNHQEQQANYVTNKNDIQEIVETDLETDLNDNLPQTERGMEIDSVLSTLGDISFNDKLTPEDLEEFLDILENILDDCKKLNISLPMTVIVTKIDNLLAENHTAAWKNISTEQLSRRVSKVFRIVDKFGLLVLETIIENESITFSTTKNIVFKAAKLPANDTINFKANNHTFGSSLVLPAQAYGSPQSLPYLAVNYKTLGNLINIIKGNEENSGYRISSDIMTLTLDENSPDRSLDPPLHLKFLKQEDFNFIHKCVFWDFHLNAGGWSTIGCELQSDNHPYVQCKCNHLTNFAVLVRPYSRIQDEEKVLSWISIIGCSISVFFSLLTAIIYIAFWKPITCDVSRMVNKITVLLCLSIALAYTTFLIGVDKIQYKVGCIVITALLHYLFLLIFFLMLALGLYYFSSISLVKISFSKATTFQSKVNFFNKIVWGIVIVIPVCITSVTIGVVFSLKKDYHSKSSCWLSFESGSLYGFIGPVAGIVLINIVFVIILSATLCSMGYSPQDKRNNRILAGIKSICTLLPVLGVTWLFGLLSINEDVVVFQYIFALLNSFQGLFIFISKCLLSKKIRKLLSESIHRNDSESWRGRLYSLLSMRSNQLSVNTKEFSSLSKGISFKGSYRDNTAL